MRHTNAAPSRALARLAPIAALALLVLGAGCKKTERELAPEASALASAVPVTETTTAFVIDAPSSSVTFEMDAELEKITGRAPGSAAGELFVDLENLQKTTGLIKVDLSKLGIYQRKRESADQEYGEETKNEDQNGHMRTWLQISEDAPADVREANRFAEFKIDKLENLSATDVSTLPGAERKVTADVSGEFRLHGRVSPQKLSVEVTFQYAGDKPSALAIKTVKPFGVELEKHDVRPRKAFDQLADATLETLGKKVDKVPDVSFEVTAKVK